MTPFVEQIAQIKVRERILRVYFQSFAVVALGLAPIPRIEVHGAQVDQRSR